MCVKCRLDGELPAGRKEFLRILAVQALHPAAAHNRYTCYAWLKDYCKGGIFLCFKLQSNLQTHSKN